MWKWQSGEMSALGQLVTTRFDELHNILFVSVGATGLRSTDWIASLGLLGISRLDASDFTAQSLNLVLQARRESFTAGPPDSQPGALDQNPFVAYAEKLAEQMALADLMVSHNAEFDIRLLNREMELSFVPEIKVPTYCTLTGWRNAFPGTRSSLSAASESLGIPRRGGSPASVEDARLTAHVFFKLCGVAPNLKFENVGEAHGGEI